MAAETGSLDGANRIRVDGIDVLRGLSVLLVVLHHIHLRFQLNQYDVRNLLPRPIGQVLFWSGYYAVIAFFVISGFLISRLSLRRWGELGRVDIRQFYVMRVARIVPCLLLLLVALSALHLATVDGFTINPERASLGRALIAALTFHVNWLEGHHGYLPGGWDVLWSLSVEEIFYLAFPLLCLFLRSERRLLLPLIALIVIGPINRALLADQDPWQDYAYLSCMDGIAFGCLAALLSARVALSKRTLRWALVVGCVIAAFVVVFRQSVAALGLPTAGVNVTLLELGIALILVALGNDVGNSVLSRGTAVVRWIGRCSYEIYLTHMFVILGVMSILERLQIAPSTIPLWYCAMLLLSIALGSLVARGFSEPMNRALRLRFLRPRQCAGNATVLGQSSHIRPD